MKNKELVIAGGGHAHMMLLDQIRDIISQGHRVTLIQPDVSHYYSGMGPGMLSGTYTPQQIRFQTKKVVESQGGQFIHDRVIRILPNKQQVELGSGQLCSYDVLSCNTGSYVPFEQFEKESDAVFTVKPIANLLRARDYIISGFKTPGLSVAVVGGGMAAAEIAGNIKYLAAQHGYHSLKITILAGSRFMKHAGGGMRRLVRKNFAKRGIHIQENCRVEQIQDHTILLNDTTTQTADCIFIATGVRPSPLFAHSELPTGGNGGLLVNAYLQCPSHPEIFGGGDCIFYQSQPLDKVGVYAVRQNPVLVNNIVNTLNGNSSLQEFNPEKSYLSIVNLGEKYGVLQKGSLCWGGKFSFFLKDYIDKKFMAKFT